MTDVVKLAHQLYRKINQQQVPEEIGWVDLVHLIADAIEELYVISGRTFLYSEDKFTLNAQIEFYKWVQASVDDQRSYSTDAMSVTHGDKPYEHIGATIDRLEKELAVIWTRMVRFNQLGVSG